MFRRSGWFFVGLFGLTVAAFWKPYVGKLPGHFDPYTHVHAALMVTWFGFLIAQPILIHRHRRALHRAVGKVSYVVVPAILVATILLAHQRTRAAPADDVEALRFTYLPLAMVALFAVAYVLAIAHRRTQALHARYMVCTVLGLVDPIVARTVFFYFPELPDPLLYQLVSYLISAGVLAFLIVRERGERTGRSAFPVMLGVTSVVYGLWFTLAQTDAWLPIARGFRDLPLT